jgi:phenylalanyl-tRNA synthetase alpha chain
MEEKLKHILHSFKNQISNSATLNELDEVFLTLFGKTGELTLIPREFSALSVEEKKVMGPLFNQVKQELERVISDKRKEIREEGYRKLEQEHLDITASEVADTPTVIRTGHLHPLTVFEQEIADIFSKMGFQQFDAPQIDSDHYNFEVLNIPEEHPARDLWDTLYIDTHNVAPNPGTLLLRTHTSNSQVRIMEQFKPPFRMMIMGRCYRYENLDARHEHTFDQFEIVYVDKGVSMANLQYLSEQFLQAIFGEEIKVRLRPKYYPFVEPGVGVDGLCIFCKGQGCQICGGAGWLELAGAGMIHPNVLKNGGIDPEEYSGIAWGFGPDRMVMLKNGIKDMRLLRSGDLRALGEAKESD